MFVTNFRRRKKNKFGPVWRKKPSEIQVFKLNTHVFIFPSLPFSLFIISLFMNEERWRRMGEEGREREKEREEERARGKTFSKRMLACAAPLESSAAARSS